ncbi:MAG: FecR domain-containing protein [Tannerellaceae bacterium]|jgi:ferric-dicitrate binding protein FerR (iron transport regulator)|nr:FecR domain-containing protein [Tannerellaceae bacterium]
MKSINQDIEIYIARYLAGEATHEDIVKLSEWLEADEANKDSFCRYNAYWNAKVELVPPLNKDAAYRKLSARLGQRKRWEAGILRKWQFYAAAAVVAAIMGWTLFGLMQTQPPSPAKEIHHYSYMSGKFVLPLCLPDGTEVSLNSNSSLTYTSHYGNNVREVSLQGEAYFRVVRNEGREFVVVMGDNRIVVLGTSFNVCYNKDDDVLTTTLMEGSIRFEAPEQTVILKPNQQLLYNRFNRKLSIHSVDGEIISAWKDNLIKYKSLPFAEFLKLLEKQYDVEIILTDHALGASQVSGTFDVSLSLEQILDMMNKSLSCKWKKNGNRYEIIK